MARCRLRLDENVCRVNGILRYRILDRDLYASRVI